MKKIVEIIPLGAGQEVGRSCILVKAFERTIMLDCGLHPGQPGLSSLPFLDTIDLSTVDLLLCSHFHIDHCAAIPYLLEKQEFTASVFMTPPTKSVYKLIVGDYLKLNAAGSDQSLYGQQALDRSMRRIETVRFGEHRSVETAHGPIKFWCYSAGHVLGAAQFCVEVEGFCFVYSGDFSCTEDRHLPAADLSSLKLEGKPRPLVAIMESTFGLQCLNTAAQRERVFVDAVRRVLFRGGKCLIPVFALGRAQELLLVLEELWHTHPEMRRFKVYFVSRLAQRCMATYKTYVHLMNERFQENTLLCPPFELKYVEVIEKPPSLTDSSSFVNLQQPCVVFASPGMLQSGFSRELFERWAPDRKNGVVIAGYAVKGTLAATLLTEPPTVISLAGRPIRRECSVFLTNFAAHADFGELSQYVRSVDAHNFVLVHGERTEMQRLQAAFATEFDKNFFAPRNCQSVLLPVDQQLEVAVPDSALVALAGGTEGCVENGNFHTNQVVGCEVRQSFSLNKVLSPFPDQATAFRALTESALFAVEQTDEGLLFAGCVRVSVCADCSLRLDWVHSAKAEVVVEVLLATAVTRWTAFLENAERTEPETHTQKNLVELGKKRDVHKHTEKVGELIKSFYSSCEVVLNEQSVSVANLGLNNLTTSKVCVTADLRNEPPSFEESFAEVCTADLNAAVLWADGLRRNVQKFVRFVTDVYTT